MGMGKCFLDLVYAWSEAAGCSKMFVRSAGPGKAVSNSERSSSGLVGRCAWVSEQAGGHPLTSELRYNLRLSLKGAGSMAFLTAVRAWILASDCLGSNRRPATHWPCDFGQLI